MNWNTLIRDLIIPLLTSAISAILSYKQAVKQSNNKIEEVKINAESEIKKIKEEANSEIEKIKAEQDEIRKTRKNDSELNNKDKEHEMLIEIASKLINNIMDNPENAETQIGALKKMERMFQGNKI